MTPQLDHPTREALSALDQPPPGVEDRLFAAILQTTGGGGDGDGEVILAGLRRSTPEI
jgi:hypothetical protein